MGADLFDGTSSSFAQNASIGDTDDLRREKFENRLLAPTIFIRDYLIMSLSVRFASLAAHEPIEGGKVRTIPSFCEECGRSRQFFCNSRGDKLIYAHTVGLGPALYFCSH